MKTRVVYTKTLSLFDGPEGKELVCPGCLKPVTGTFAVDGTMEVNLGGESVHAGMTDGTVVGVKIEHDCMPKATR